MIAGVGKSAVKVIIESVTIHYMQISQRSLFAFNRHPIPLIRFQLLYNVHLAYSPAWNSKTSKLEARLNYCCLESISMVINGRARQPRVILSMNLSRLPILFIRNCLASHLLWFWLLFRPATKVSRTL